MFNCCTSCDNVPGGPGYIVKKKGQKADFRTSVNQIKEDELKDKNVSILKVIKSEYQNINTGLKNKTRRFVDSNFFIGDDALGDFSNLRNVKWKRIAEVIPNSKLFGKRITPKDVVQKSSNENAFYATMAALAENENRIKEIFVTDRISSESIYPLLLRINGKIQEVIVDDYIPVDDVDKPIFTQPTEQNAVWLMLLEKARAKVAGSYSKLYKTFITPKQVFQQLTFAPTEMRRTAPISEDPTQQILWNFIYQNSRQNRPSVSHIAENSKINYKNLNLDPDAFYTLLDARVLQHKLGSAFRVMKLRNNKNKQVYKGQGSQSDSLFWDQIKQSEDKTELLDAGDAGKEGIFYMLYNDYLKYFTTTYINLIEDNANYVCEPFNNSDNFRSIYELKVITEGLYTIFIDQNNLLPLSGEEATQDGYCRATIIVIKDQSTNEKPRNYCFLDGTLKYNQQITTLKVHLTPGKYILYSKLEPTLVQQNFPESANMVVYSACSILLKPSNIVLHNDLLRNAYLDHARKNKMHFYNNEMMWSSWKKLIKEGGYAYMAFGNSSKSLQKFVLSINQSTINSYNFNLKKPLKGNGEQIIQVKPGKQEIVLLRVKNSNIKSIEFPPPMQLQIVEV